MIGIDPFLIRQMAEKGNRLDNRAEDEYRPVLIEAGIVPSAEGSCRVKLGDTEIIAGVKISTGTPFSDTPDEGVLMVSAEFLVFAYHEFEYGPPSVEAVELARVVDRAIRESKCIDFGKLCITPGEKVWMVNVDIDVLNHDGNMIDAAGIAAIAALYNARMPRLVDGNIDYEKREEKLPITGIPISTTFVKIRDRIFADPTPTEESAMDARLTVGTIDAGTFCSMQKGGASGLLQEDVEKILDLAEQKGEELRAIVRDAVK